VPGSSTLCPSPHRHRGGLCGSGDSCASYAPFPAPIRSPLLKDSTHVLQDNSLKHLHYVDSQSKFPVRSGLEDLPERIELASITEIATANCAPPSDNTSVVGTPVLEASPLSFSLLTPEGSRADAIAPDISHWADWTDGLNMLRRDSGHVASKETADFIQALTEIGLKIKLLGTRAHILHLAAPSTANNLYITFFPIPRFVGGQSGDTQRADRRSATRQ
jgi:hypothetical protein